MTETLMTADEETGVLHGFGLTESVSLPMDWKVVQLKDVLEEVNVRVHDLGHQKEIDHPILSLTKDLGLILQSGRFKKRIATDDVSSYKVVRRGHIVYNPYVIWEGAIHVLTKFESGIVSPVYCVWRVIEDCADPYFLGHLLRMPFAIEAYSRLASGAVNRRRTIRKNDFLDIYIPLPPLDEQQAIVHVLAAVQRAKESTDKVIAATRELKKSLMQYLFTYGPVPVEEAERVPLKETEIGPVPPKWEVKAFEDAFVGTARAPKVKRSDYRPVGRVPVIDQGKGFIAGFVDNVEPYQRTLPVIVFGDHTRIFKFVDFPFVVGADGTKVLIPNYDLFEPRFLFYALTRVDLPSRGYNRHFHLLREVSLPLPPLHEQRKIACILQAVDRKIEAEEQRKAALDVLFKTLLHLLMTGRMRVKDLPLPEAEGVLPGASRE